MSAHTSLRAKRHRKAHSPWMSSRAVHPCSANVPPYLWWLQVLSPVHHPVYNDVYGVYWCARPFDQNRYSGINSAISWPQHYFLDMCNRLLRHYTMMAKSPHQSLFKSPTTSMTLLHVSESWLKCLERSFFSQISIIISESYPNPIPDPQKILQKPWEKSWKIIHQLPCFSRLKLHTISTLSHWIFSSSHSIAQSVVTSQIP